MNSELFEKVQYVVNQMKTQKSQYERSIKSSLENLIKLQEKKEEKNYRNYLEIYNLQIMTLKAKIKKCDLFIKRCNCYLDYLKSFDQNDSLLIEKKKFQFIRSFQEEIIHDINSEIEKNNQQNLICNLKGESVDYKIKNQFMEKRKEIYNKFLNEDFKINEEKLNSTDYLNFNTFELMNLLYSKKKKKAS